LRTFFGDIHGCKHAAAGYLSGCLLLMVGIGFWAWRSSRNFDDYILGGRSLGSFVTALSAGASDPSGWLLMGGSA